MGKMFDAEKFERETRRRQMEKILELEKRVRDAENRIEKILIENENLKLENDNYETLRKAFLELLRRYKTECAFSHPDMEHEWMEIAGLI